MRLPIQGHATSHLRAVTHCFQAHVLIPDRYSDGSWGNDFASSPSKAYPPSHNQPGAGSRGLRVGHTDLTIPQTRSGTIHAHGHAHRNTQGTLPRPQLTVTVYWGCLGPRPHSGQECGCRHAGASESHNAGCGCLEQERDVSISSVLSPDPSTSPPSLSAGSAHHPGGASESRTWACGSQSRTWASGSHTWVSARRLRPCHLGAVSPCRHREQVG